MSFLCSRSKMPTTLSSNPFSSFQGFSRGDQIVLTRLYGPLLFNKLYRLINFSQTVNSGAELEYRVKTATAGRLHLVF